MEWKTTPARQLTTRLELRASLDALAPLLVPDSAVAFSLALLWEYHLKSRKGQKTDALARVSASFFLDALGLV